MGGPNSLTTLEGLLAAHFTIESGILRELKERAAFANTRLSLVEQAMGAGYISDVGAPYAGHVAAWL